MKKTAIILLLSSTLLLAACSNNVNEDTVDSTSNVETNANEDKAEKEKKLADEKKKADQKEKERQELIAQKVKEADEAMKAAEANPTDDSYSVAKAAVEAIPDGNPDLQKRLDTVSASLNAIKQQLAVQQQQVQQQQVQQQQSNPDPDFIDNDGNGYDDRSEFNDDAKRAQGAAMEAEANANWHAQNDAVQQRDQYAEDFEAQHGRQPSSGEIQSQWLQEQGITDANGNLIE